MLNYDLKNITQEKGLNRQEDIYGLLFIRKNLSVLGQINENIWNNKKTLQLTIKDIVI